MFLVLLLTAVGLNDLTVADQCSFSVVQRVDCYPEPGATQFSCENRGCCWKPVDQDTPLENVPWCFYGSDFKSYDSVSQQKLSNGLTAELKLVGKGAPYGNNIDRLKVDVTYETPSRLRVLITDATSSRYQVPVELTKKDQVVKDNQRLYDVKYRTSPASISVVRRSNGNMVFDTSAGPLLFADQFLHVTSYLSGDNIYGLGEHSIPLKLPMSWYKLTMFSRDVPNLESPQNSYGVHPFYVNFDGEGNAHGVLLLNSNAMDVVLQPTPAITYRTIGGVLDFYIFLGPSPDDVIAQYNELIGFPILPPYWALGFHLCRYGYKSSAEVRQVVERNRKIGLPFDVQWVDIDYMDQYKDFTVGQSFSDLAKVTNELHSYNMKLIPILDPGIPPDMSYSPYSEGIKADVFIKDETGKPMIGKVWSGLNVFPDFTNNNTLPYWQKMLGELHKLFDYDGMWIDMNEPANFVDGSINGCPKNRLENPPYVPGVHNGKLSALTLCMSGKQAAGYHYDLHSLYGLFQSKVTYLAMKNLFKKRPFVLSRSTYPTSGRYAAHWLGDNFSTWRSMYLSIPGMLTLNMFGIPFVGADICGFIGTPSDELCARWMQLGAFYPFSRNHNDNVAPHQDPAILSDVVKTASKNALRLRYLLLPYLYTLLWKASVGRTGAVVRSLYFEFPQDGETHSIDSQFLWGDSVLITPVLEKGATTVKGYFPSGAWYSIPSGDMLPYTGYVMLDAPLTSINLHVRGGKIVPTQQPSTTTGESRSLPFGLVVALSGNGVASGQLYVDDGESYDSYTSGAYLLVEFNAANGTLQPKFLNQGYQPGQGLGEVLVFGADLVSQVLLNGKPVKFNYFADKKVLVVHSLSQPLNNDFTLKWN